MDGHLRGHALAHQEFYPRIATASFPRLADYGASVSATDYARATRQRQATRALIDELLSGIDVLVCPAMPAPAGPQPDPLAVMAPAEVPALVRFTAPTNLSGHPSLTLPNGFTGAGLPTAMQFIGRHGDGPRCCARVPPRAGDRLASTSSAL